MKTSLMKNSTYQPLFYSKMKHSLLDLKKKRGKLFCVGSMYGEEAILASLLIFLHTLFTTTNKTCHKIKSYFDIYYQEREM